LVDEVDDLLGGEACVDDEFGADAVDLLVTDEAPAPALAQVFAAAGLEVRVGASSDPSL
jgi:DeoR family glycerol-3-phosphate regulon repressor